jgi:DNA-binding transcriptional MerR regulator
MINNKEHVSLSELAKITGMNKSHLAYYHKINLISPLMTVGKMHVFDAKKAIARIKEVKQYQKKGYKLKEIGLLLSEIVEK